MQQTAHHHKVTYLPKEYHKLENFLEAVRAQKSKIRTEADGVSNMVKKGFNLPCGQCWGCRLQHSREWAVRCMHEAQMHEHNSFITLTINPANQTVT